MRNHSRFTTVRHILALGIFLAVSTGAAALRDFDLPSVNSAGEATGNGGSRNPVVSSNGQFIAFASKETNLVANYANGPFDLFVWDSADNSVTLASRNTFPMMDSFSGAGTSSLLVGGVLGGGLSLAPIAREIGGNVVRLPAEGTRFYRLVPTVPPRPGEKLTQ